MTLVRFLINDTIEEHVYTKNYSEDQTTEQALLQEPEEKLETEPVEETAISNNNNSELDTERMLDGVPDNEWHDYDHISGEEYVGEEVVFG